MKILIAILGCHARPELRHAQRATWLNHIPAGVDYRYFLGRTPQPRPIDERRPSSHYTPPPSSPLPLPDEICLDVPDTYEALPLKTRGIVMYAVERGYDFVLKCDDDSYFRVDRLLASGFEKHDCYGCRRQGWPQGGAGYWLSRRALEIIAREPKELDADCHCEDVVTGRILARHGIEIVHDDRYQPDVRLAPPPRPDNDLVSTHKVSPDLMLDLDSRFPVVPAAVVPELGVGATPTPPQRSASRKPRRSRAVPIQN